MLLICCPYCVTVLDTVAGSDQAWDAPESCDGCGRDPRRDAPIEMTSERWAAMPRVRCASCAEPMPQIAVVCSRCRAPRDGAGLRFVDEPWRVPHGWVAQHGDRVAFHDRSDGLVVLRFATSTPVRELASPVGWQRSVALSSSGTTAVVGEGGVSLTRVGGRTVALGAPEGVDPAAVGFVGETPIVFPGVRSDGDGPLVPWMHRDERWHPTPLPSAEGFTDDLDDVWELDGFAAPLASGDTGVIWDGRVYVTRGDVFRPLDVARLRTRTVAAAAPFRDGWLVESAGQLVRLGVGGVGGVDASFTSPRRGVRAVRPAPRGAVLALLSRIDDADDTVALVLFADGQVAPLDARSLGISAAGAEIFAAGDRLYVLDADAGAPRSVPWDAVIAFAAARAR